MSKTKSEKKVLNKTEKAAAQMAYDAGRQAREGDLSRDGHPSSPEYVKESWLRGWDEADETEKSVDEANRMPDATDSPDTQNGHDFKDPTVIEHGTNLADLMDAFDNSGVSIEEVAWRKLSVEEQGIATRWVNGRRIGAMSPVPIFLMPFATPELKAESSMYAEDQLRIRRVIMPCTFGKPSPTKPDGEEAEESIKVQILVPVGELSASTANDLFGWRRCRIEFSRRDVNTWDQKEIPGVEQTVVCVADVSGFSRNRTHWRFGFLVAQSILSIVDAFEVYWKSGGSCRIECLGEPIKHEPDESENPALSQSDEQEPNEVRQPSLFNDGKDEPRSNVLRQFIVPLEKHDGVACTVGSILSPKNGRWYVSCDMDYTDVNGEDAALGEGEAPQLIGDGYVSESEGIISALGRLIQDADDETLGNAPKELVASLKDELNRVIQGGALLPMPSDGDEVTF